MEQLALEQEVTDLLISGLKQKKDPSIGLYFCRKATECIVQNKLYQETGEKTKEERGKPFPSLNRITMNLKKLGFIDHQTATRIESINAETRKGIHWDFETKGMPADFEDVELIVKQVESVYYKCFKERISTKNIFGFKTKNKYRFNVFISKYGYNA